MAEGSLLRAERSLDKVSIYSKYTQRKQEKKNSSPPLFSKLETILTVVSPAFAATECATSISLSSPRNTARYQNEQHTTIRSKRKNIMGKHQLDKGKDR